MGTSKEQKQQGSFDELLQLTGLYADRMEQLKQEAEAEEKKSGRELVLWTAIAGIRHHVDPDSRAGRKLLKSLTPGTFLTLRREPENPYDQWAVAVETGDGRMLGYITRYKNETIARMMDHGHRFEAQVEELRGEELEEAERKRAATEDHLLPFSVWLTD